MLSSDYTVDQGLLLPLNVQRFFGMHLKCWVKARGEGAFHLQASAG